jgi:hypothetical protein
MQEERIDASKQLSGPSTTKYSGDKKEFAAFADKKNQNQTRIDFMMML